MQLARRSPSGAPAQDAGSAAPCVDAEVERELTRVRQAYLDALPIAAAIVSTRAGAPAVVDRNLAFVRVEALTDPSGIERPVLLREGIAARVASFLACGDADITFDWSDGSGIEARHFEVRLARLPRSGAEDRCLLSLVDRTAEIETRRSLRAEMLHDSLTGLPNRAAFIEAVEQAIAEERPVAVLVIDLTRFSRVNECMGPLAGDELIITVARRLVGTVRAGDMLARLGGDEFGILLKVGNGPSDAVRAAERIEKTLTVPFRLSELEIRIDCAMGCAMLNDRISVSEDLIRNAQFAMKRAKLTGRLGVYQAGEVNAVRRRFAIETELRRAIESDQLALAFQPLIDLQTGALTGFEALARWQHPDRGAISPVEFIPVAEESGLIVPLGRWAAETAARTLATWDERAGAVLPLSVSVNLSAIQIARDDIAALIAQAVGQAGIHGSRMTVELTESAIINDPERATRALHALKELEIRIAMDDFGTGYSNLAYLQKLPIDILKIDRSFVAPMLRDRDSVAIVRAVLSLADALGMATTAEGVETVELAQTLAALGCSLGQGYHFAAPLEADAAFAYWRARST